MIALIINAQIHNTTFAQCGAKSEFKPFATSWRIIYKFKFEQYTNRIIAKMGRQIDSE